MVSNYLSCNTWLYSHAEKLKIEIKPRISERYIVEFALETNKVEMQFNREDLVTLRDKIDNALLDD